MALARCLVAEEQVAPDPAPVWSSSGRPRGRPKLSLVVQFGPVVAGLDGGPPVRVVLVLACSVQLYSVDFAKNSPDAGFSAVKFCKGKPRPDLVRGSSLFGYVGWPRSVLYLVEIAVALLYFVCFVLVIALIHSL